MNVQRKVGKARRPTNVSLPADLIDEARTLNVNISKACEAGLLTEVARTRSDRWREENRSAIQYWNRWVEENGLPLEEYSPL